MQCNLLHTNTMSLFTELQWQTGSRLNYVFIFIILRCAINLEQNLISSSDCCFKVVREISNREAKMQKFLGFNYETFLSEEV